MTIDYTKEFVKRFKKLRPPEQQRFLNNLEIFKINPLDARLNNHPLKGKYKGLRSINVGGDIRALYIETDNSLILFALIGTHSQLYG